MVKIEPKGKAPDKMLKVTDITDLGKKLVLLDSGTYLIDGEIISNTGYNKKQVAVKDINDIRLVSQIKFLSHYEDSDGNKLSKDLYNESVRELTKNAISDDSFYFPQEFIDEEYAYKKFKIKWNPIYRTVQELSEPILVEIEHTKYNTGNPFIKSMFFSGESDDLKLFLYDKVSARLDIVDKYMSKLGFTFVGDKNNYDITKEWANSTHSVIKYVKAFGGYVFNGWDEKHSPRGILSDMETLYNNDKVSIEKIIHDKYISKFGTIDKTQYDFNLLLANLRQLENNISAIDYKVKSADDYRKSKNSVRQIIEDLQNKMEVKK